MWVRVRVRVQVGGGSVVWVRVQVWLWLWLWVRLWVGWSGVGSVRGGCGGGEGVVVGEGASMVVVVGRVGWVWVGWVQVWVWMRVRVWSWVQVRVWVQLCGVVWVGTLGPALISSTPGFTVNEHYLTASFTRGYILCFTHLVGIGHVLP